MVEYNVGMNNLKHKLSILCGIGAVVCLSAVFALFLRQNAIDSATRETLAQMQATAESPETTVSEGDFVNPDSLPQEDIQEESTDPLPELADNPYEESFLANTDMAAWLKIEDTLIDYPVMWTPREETYYLYRNFQGNEDKNGCLILDTDSCLSPLTTNLIIHGHNMKSGAMFGNLTNYEDENYCKEHNLISLYTEDQELRYEVIAVFRSQVYKKTDQVFKFYKFFQADTPEEFDDFYENIKELSLYDTGVTAQFGDRFLTLSTCVYHVDHGRFVVVAKEIEPGDSYKDFRHREESNY